MFSTFSTYSYYQCQKKKKLGGNSSVNLFKTCEFSTLTQAIFVKKKEVPLLRLRRPFEQNEVYYLNLGKI